MRVAPRVASLQPSVSVTMAALGRLECLAACTKYCLAQTPGISTKKITVLPDSWNFGEEEIAALRASGAQLVIASVPYTTQSLEAILRAGLAVLALSPRSLADVYADTRWIASLLDASAAADEVVRVFEEELAGVRAHAPAKRQTLYCEEWGKPLIHSQPWVYELASAAGADAIGDPGAHTTAEAVAAADPDIVLLSWCGAGDRVPAARVIQQRGWQALRAVRNRRVHVVHDEWLNTPALPSLTLGLRRIAELVRAS